MATTLAHIQQRRKTAAAWTSSNEVLLAGEIGAETDTPKWKLGDGSTAWNSLAYQPSNSSVTAAIAAQAASDSATSATLWKANTAYLAGQAVVNPSGFVVTALTGFTSGSSYSAANWSDPIAAGYVALGSAFRSVKDYGAKGDGSTDDTTAIANALAAGAGTVLFPAGTYITGTQTIPSNVHLQGAAVGATILKLKNGTNADLLTVASFGTLTGTTSNAGASKFAIRNMTLDGNKANNSSGWVMRIFAFDYVIDSVEFLRGASGGVWAEWGTGGSNMEARWSNFKIGNCDSGNGFEIRGPHDSQFVNGVVFRDTSNTPTRAGIGINIAGYGGGQFTNVHVWGTWTQQWVIRGGQLLTNCVSDGPGGVTILSDLVNWIGGAIYSDNGVTAGDVGITFGDGTTQTIRNCLINTVMFNYGTNQMMHRVRTACTMTANRFIVNGNLGNNNTYTVGEGLSTTTATTTGTWTTLAVASTASFPASGNIHISDGTTTVRVAYTGISGNTLTGIPSQTAAINSGAGVFLFNSQTADFWDVSNPFDTNSRGRFQTALQSSQSRNWQEATTNYYGQVVMQNFALSSKAASGTTVAKVNSDGSLQPGVSTAGVGARLWSGSGAPATPGGSLTYNLGDAYLRTDTPTTANQRLYLVTTAGASPTWTGVL